MSSTSTTSTKSTETQTVSTQPDPLADVPDFLARYLHCSEHQRTVLALWVLHTYCFHTARVTPYLSIRSAEKQSGKTLCLQLLALLCEGSALTSGGLKASDLALPMQQKRISALLLDECHATLGAGTRCKSPALRALLTGSFNLLLGYNNLKEERNAFCPKAFAGNGPPPEDLADRSIPIILEPLEAQPSKIHSDNDAATGPCSLSPVPCSLPDRLDLRRAADQVQPIRDRLNHWAHVHLLPLLDKMPPLPRSAFPPNLSPRQQDLCEPLLQLAGLIGGPWPRRALEAFSIIFELQTIFELRPNLQLLADIRDCFAHHNYPERLFTEDLVEWGNSLPARPWDKDGRFTAHTLARLLKPFAIRPRNQRIKKGKGKSTSKPLRGYQLADFQEAWQKHLNFPASPSEITNSKSEIVNKACPPGELASRRDAVCNTVSLTHARVAQPPSAVAAVRSEPTQKSEIENLKSRITCSPECELTGRPAKPKDQNYDVTKLSIQEIRQRKEDLIRELAPLFAEAVPGGEPETANHEPETANQKSEITNKACPRGELASRRDTVSNAVSLVATTAVPAETSNPKSEIKNLKPKESNNHKSEIENLKSKRPEPQEWSVLRERLRSLRDQLCLKGSLDIISMSCSYTPAALQARLDWVDANPRWLDFKRGMSADDFIYTFARLNSNALW